uniref:Uncharacterized protein n=1 Tax=Meloidogyne hapla TaxID=6305 RepID=A0A1I8BSF1_MELHA
MKINSIIFILFINVILWNFISTSSKRKGGKLSKSEGSPSNKKEKQLYNNVTDLKIKNNCKTKIPKEIYPNDNTQEALINDYLNKNKKFVAALNQAQNNTNIIFVLNRFTNEEYKKEYIKGIIALYHFGEVSMNNLLIKLKIQHRFVQLVLAAHGICIYNNRGSTKHTKGVVKEDLDKLNEKIKNGINTITVTEETINQILKTPHNENPKNRKNKNFEEETDEEEYEEDFEEDSNEFHQMEENYFQPTTSNLFQTPEDHDEYYWENWNEMTEDKSK